MSSVYALLCLAKQFCLYISQSMAISWMEVISAFVSCSKCMVSARRRRPDFAVIGSDTGF